MRVLISGTLHDAPTIKTSKAGKEFCIGKIKDDSTNPATWASIVCFDGQAAALAGMKKGEALSVSGKLTVDVYQPAQGEPRANISITCDSLITMKAARKSQTTGSNDKKLIKAKNSGFHISDHRQREHLPVPSPAAHVDDDDPF